MRVLTRPRRRGLDLFGNRPDSSKRKIECNCFWSKKKKFIPPRWESGNKGQSTPDGEDIRARPVASEPRTQRCLELSNQSSGRLGVNKKVSGGTGRGGSCACQRAVLDLG